MLSRAAQKSDAHVIEQKTQFKLPAGDQGCESLSGHLNNTLRRLGNKGRVRRKKADAPSVQGLAAARLLRRPGLKSVLDALGLCRESASQGLVKIPVSKTWCYKTAGKVWLYAD
mmetsp:Transcript_39790/g.71570  ORF Transcript_39790/g.71570 Transcript_39790/m.71570 type:complete len:114 (+) Transcript_39790:226-567(+)